uniref:Uncharacterized protein n=1 Tax=Brassica oleracea TaxID=3712 RepID=A0A3P6CY27_BRAOL|nr:unnamed protein product [Brassica oleracea]
MAMKPNGKSIATSDYDDKVMFLKDVSLGHHESQLRFRLIHFWEAWNPVKKTLTGLEMLIIDEQLVNGQSINEAPVLDEVEIAKARRVLIHVQSHNGPVMKPYLWDQSARDFCIKFKSYEKTPTMLLVTTVNAKTLGGTLALTSMSSSRVFMDYDVQPTIDYFGWLRSNPAIAEEINAEVVTKCETMTIGKIFSYIKQEHAKVTKGPTSMICTNSKCGKVIVSGVPHF